MKRLLFAILILAVGLGVAMLFRKQPDDQQTAQQSNSALNFMSDDEEDTAAGQAVPRRQGVPLPTPFDPTAKTAPPLEAPPMPTVQPPAVSQPSAELVRVPPSLPALDRAVLPSLSEVDAAKRAPFSNSSVVPPAERIGPPAVAVDPRRDSPRKLDSGVRTHTIVNGDTLTRLAKRYLGDADRSTDIFEMNRGVLRDSEVLPIGEKIKIPIRKRKSPKAVDVRYRPPRSTESATTPKLVPLPPGTFGSSR